MAEWGLVADLRSSGVRLCPVSSASIAATQHCITDPARRDVFPLDSPFLWPEDTAAALSVRERVRWLTALVKNEEAPHNQDAVKRNAMALLTEGLKQFAERQSQRTVKDVAVLLSGSVSRVYQELFDGGRSPWILNRASMALYAYEPSQAYLDMDDIGYIVIADVDQSTLTATVAKVGDGFFHTLQSSHQSIHGGFNRAVSLVFNTVLQQHNLAVAEVAEVILMGDIRGRMLDEMVATVHALVPNTNLHTSIPPEEVAIRGATTLMRRLLKRPIAMCSLTPSLVSISVKVMGDRAWPLISRYYALPTARQTRLRVYVPPVNSTAKSPAVQTGPVLQFFDGESAFVHENTMLGAIQLPALVSGWNDIDVDVHLGNDYVLSVRASQTIAGYRCSPAIELEVSSIVVGMSMEELAEYSTRQDDLALSSRRETHIERMCSEDWLRSARELLQRDAPRTLVHAGQLLPSVHRTSVSLSDSSANRLAALLDGVDWSQDGAFNASSLRAAVIELIGETAVEEASGSWSCTT